MAGISLAKKLQIRAGHRVLALAVPANTAPALESLPKGATLSTSGRGPFDVVVAFAADQQRLARIAKRVTGAVGAGGLLWLAYPRTASGVSTDLTRDLGWDAVTLQGWVGVARIAFDGTWWALRFRPLKPDARGRQAARK